MWRQVFRSSYAASVFMAALTRCTALTPTPSVLATFRMPVPVARRSLIANSIRLDMGGRPSLMPRARALSSPALTRARLLGQRLPR